MPNRSDTLRLERTTLLLADFERALTRLADALGQPESELIRDAAIQRFEFCFELAWKSVQSVARLEGQDCTSPRTAFSLAWGNGWVSTEAAWLDMLDDRNKTTHTYHELTARQVFGNLPRHLPHLTEQHQALAARAREIQAQDAQRPGT